MNKWAQLVVLSLVMLLFTQGQANASLFDWLLNKDQGSELITVLSSNDIAYNPDQIWSQIEASNSMDSIQKSSEEILFDKIAATETKNGLKDGVLKRVIACESRFDPEVYGDHGVAYGIAQFHEDTFDWLKEKSDKNDLKYKGLDDQLELMGWAFANGYANHWSCWNRVVGKYFGWRPIAPQTQTSA